MAAVFMLWLLVLAGVYSFQRLLIFQTNRRQPGYVFHFKEPFSEQFLTTPENFRLSALYFPTTKTRKGAILYFHGNADDLQRWGQYAEDLTRRGYDVLMMDYRGYGKSEGRPDEAAYYRDARLWYDWLSTKFPPNQIIIYGRSLGTSIASQLATSADARMLILETPFDNIRNAIQLRPPVFWLPFDLRYHFSNDQHLAKIKCPVYIFQGTNDWVVPYRSAAALKPLLKNNDRFFTIPGGSHKNLADFDEFQDHLDLILLQAQPF